MPSHYKLLERYRKKAETKLKNRRKSAKASASKPCPPGKIRDGKSKRCRTPAAIRKSRGLCADPNKRKDADGVCRETHATKLARARARGCPEGRYLDEKTLKCKVKQSYVRHQKELARLRRNMRSAERRRELNPNMKPYVPRHKKELQNHFPPGVDNIVAQYAGLPM